MSYPTTADIKSFLARLHAAIAENLATKSIVNLNNEKLLYFILNDEDNFIRMVCILNESPDMWMWEFVKNHNSCCGFMWDKSPEFNELQSKFYADGLKSMDSRIAYLCRKMQFIAKYGLQAFEEEIIMDLEYQIIAELKRQTLIKEYEEQSGVKA